MATAKDYPDQVLHKYTLHVATWHFGMCALPGSVVCCYFIPTDYKINTCEHSIASYGCDSVLHFLQHYNVMCYDLESGRLVVDMSTTLHFEYYCNVQLT